MLVNLIGISFFVVFSKKLPLTQKMGTLTQVGVNWYHMREYKIFSKIKYKLTNSMGGTLI